MQTHFVFVDPFLAARIGLFALLTLCVLPFSIRLPQEWKPLASTGLLSLAVALVIPFVYADSVSHTLDNDLHDALQSSRPQRAFELAAALLTLDPDARYENVPLRDVVTNLDQHLRQLRAAVAQPLSPHAPLMQIGQRATLLVQLERLDEAMQTLAPISAPRTGSPIAWDYQGLCCQRLRRWDESQQWYARARDFWQKQPASETRTHSLVSALKGIAFAERQRDRPQESEQAYLSALELADDPELHFLLARLYEEQQLTAKAVQHASRARDLAPATYTEQANGLIDKMSLSHFGCLSAR